MRELHDVIGQNIRKHRKRQGLTQEQLAASASLSSDYISRLECGKENPTLDVLMRISRACYVKLSTLVEGL